jgi:hypothetical protein
VVCAWNDAAMPNPPEIQHAGPKIHTLLESRYTSSRLRVRSCTLGPGFCFRPATKLSPKGFIFITM